LKYKERPVPPDGQHWQTSYGYQSEITLSESLKLANILSLLAPMKASQGVLVILNVTDRPIGEGSLVEFCLPSLRQIPCRTFRPNTTLLL
jgi:hypothetical protein